MRQVFGSLMSLIQSCLFEVFKAIVTAGFAVLVFIVGQAFVRLWIEPVIELRKVIAQMRSDFVYYGARFHSPANVPDEDWMEAKQVFRRHGVTLHAYESLASGILFYDQVAKTFTLPCRQQAREAAPCFFYLSNTDKNPTAQDFVWINAKEKDIRRLLSLAEG